MVYMHHGPSHTTTKAFYIKKTPGRANNKFAVVKKTSWQDPQYEWDGNKDTCDYFMFGFFKHLWIIKKTESKH